MQFDPRPALTRRSTLTTAVCCALSLSACAELPSARLRVPETFRERCAGPVSAMETQGDRDAFMVRQEAALGACEAKRAGLVGLIDATAPKRPWWQFPKPDS